MTLGEKIRKLREQKALSQKQVALSIGLDRSQYSRIETDKSEPAISTLTKIAQVLGVSTAFFFSEEEVLDINTFDQSLVQRVKMLDELEEKPKSYILGMIDMALANKRLKDSLQNALNLTQ